MSRAIFQPHSVSRGSAPVPDKFPGEFFVVEFDREDRSYVLHLDDEGKSTFYLGDDIDRVCAIFTSREFDARKVADMVDRAREFGACQYIPSRFPYIEDRIIQLLPRAAATVTQRLFEEPANAGWNSLR